MYMTVILSVLCYYLVYGYGAWATNHRVIILTYITRVHAQPNKRICINSLNVIYRRGLVDSKKGEGRKKDFLFQNQKQNKSKEENYLSDRIT